MRSSNTVTFARAGSLSATIPSSKSPEHSNSVLLEAELALEKMHVRFAMGIKSKNAALRVSSQVDTNKQINVNRTRVNPYSNPNPSPLTVNPKP